MIAIDRASRQGRALLDAIHRRRPPVVIPAGALAQVWRNGRRQVRLARLLRHDGVTVEGLDEPTARAVGVLLGARRATDVIDASVVVVARRRDGVVVTGDPDDLRALDSALDLAPIT